MGIEYKGKQNLRKGGREAVAAGMFAGTTSELPASRKSCNASIIRFCRPEGTYPGAGSQGIRLIPLVNRSQGRSVSILPMLLPDSEGGMYLSLISLSFSLSSYLYVPLRQALQDLDICLHVSQTLSESG